MHSSHIFCCDDKAFEATVSFRLGRRVTRMAANKFDTKFLVAGKFSLQIAKMYGDFWETLGYFFIHTFGQPA